MLDIQIHAAAPPFDRPALGVRAARLLGLAEAMGLLPPGDPIYRLDAQAMRGPVEELVRRGIGRHASLQLAATDEPERLAELLDELYGELEASPVPAAESARLTAVFGLDLLAKLTGASTSSLRRYAAAERVAPDGVAARLHHLARINAHLAGGYNDFGIRRWYARPRVQLDGHPPPICSRAPGTPTPKGRSAPCAWLRRSTARRRHDLLPARGPSLPLPVGIGRAAAGAVARGRRGPCPLPVRHPRGRLGRVPPP